jgi:hypothetical protein
MAMTASAVDADPEDMHFWIPLYFFIFIYQKYDIFVPAMGIPCSHCASAFDRHTLGNVWASGHRICGAHGIPFAGRVLGDTAPSSAGVPRQHL